MSLAERARRIIDAAKDMARKGGPVIATLPDGTEVIGASCPDCHTRCPKWVARDERCGKTFSERMGAK